MTHRSAIEGPLCLYWADGAFADLAEQATICGHASCYTIVSEGCTS